MKRPIRIRDTHKIHPVQYLMMRDDDVLNEIARSYAKLDFVVEILRDALEMYARGDRISPHRAMLALDEAFPGEYSDPLGDKQN